MAQILVLRLAAPASWVVMDGGGTRLGPVATGALADAAPMAADRRVIALVPGQEALIARPLLPVRSGARVAQVVPFALEDQLAGDVDTFHFAVGRPGEDGRTPVAAMERDRLEGWLQRLAEAGIVPEALYAETQCLPDNPGKIVVLLEDNALLVRAPGRVPFTLVAEPLTEAFALADLEGDDRHVQLFVAQQDWESSRDVIETLREVAGSLDVQLLPDGGLPLLAATALAAPPLSLLTGAYAPRVGWRASWRRWRVAAGLAAALFVVHAAAGTYDFVRQRVEERRLDAEIEQTFRFAMPNVERIVDARRQMAERLGGTSGPDPFGLLGRLEQLARATVAVPGVRLQSLGWRQGNLELRISAPSGDVLSELARVAGQYGLVLTVHSTLPRADGVDGLVTVGTGGPT